MERHIKPRKNEREKVGKKAKPHLLFGRKNYAPKEMALARFEICKSCPELIRPTNQCRQCGCFMHLKTKLIQAECPLGKWR